MVEGAPLLREYTREGIVGSNPILSAINTLISRSQRYRNERRFGLLIHRAQDAPPNVQPFTRIQALQRSKNRGDSCCSLAILSFFHRRKAWFAGSKCLLPKAIVKDL